MFVFEVNDKINLKMLSSRDADDLFAVIDANRSYLKEWLPWVPQMTEAADVKSFIQDTREQFAAENGWQAGIWYQEELVGVIGFHSVDWKNQKTTLGYWLAEDYQGQGIMTTCCQILIDHAFRVWELNKVEIRAAAKNHKSRAIPERLGLKEEGTIREAELLDDSFVDHVVYGILQREWKSKN